MLQSAHKDTLDNLRIINHMSYTSFECKLTVRTKVRLLLEHNDEKQLLRCLRYLINTLIHYHAHEESPVLPKYRANDSKANYEACLALATKLENYQGPMYQLANDIAATTPIDDGYSFACTVSDNITQLEIINLVSATTLNPRQLPLIHAILEQALDLIFSAAPICNLMPRLAKIC